MPKENILGKIYYMKNVLEVNNLAVTLDGREILKDISFALERGESLAIIGPNGSGKTVLLKTLLGFLPYSGEMRWATGVRLGYVPQKIEADRHLPINFRNLLLAKAGVMNLKKSAIDEVIKEIHLTQEILKTPVGVLSGGQFQKCLIAFALLGKPEVVLFDEPTASVDEVGEEQIYELIHRLEDDYGITPIVVSHDLSFVYRYAAKVLCLNRQGLCFGTPQEALTPKILHELYGRPFAHYYHQHDHEKTHQIDA